MRISSVAVALFPLAGLLPAQHFGFGLGVKGGFPFTDLVEAVTSSPVSLSQGDNYIVGPFAELRIPFGFALEVDGLYRGTRYHVANAESGLTAIQSSSWEIPYLAKFRFPIPLLKPFISIGGAYRTFNDLPPGVTATHNAFVAGGGLELKVSKLRISGEARYLRWGQPPPNNLARLAQSQGELLFGLAF